MVFYLKYRPKNLDELDNREVAELIGKYLSRESLPHAFLFSGPRGTGKTSTARIVAKAINCINGKRKTACGKCDICLSISKGAEMDVLEIDAASNRGIDEIRDLREKIKLSPLRLKYKIYIIDEVHMLTTEAFNALLKTLEEPPPHAVFILATTELYKVPETIVSRCIRVNFHKATAEELERSVGRVVSGEKLEIDGPAIKEISRIADGSFRDAAKILEELALEKGRITEDVVRRKSGQAGSAREDEFIEILRQKKTQAAILEIKKLEADGVLLRRFIQSILLKLEAMVIDSFTAKQEWPRAEILRAANFLQAAFADLKFSVVDTLPFITAVIRICEPESPPAEVVLKPAVKPVKTEVEASASEAVQKWELILEKLKPLNHSLAGVLRSCRPLKLENGILTIEAAYKFHAERINDPKTISAVGQVIGTVLGQPVKIQTQIKARS